MNLHKLILINNACYKAGRTITPKGIMVHSTGQIINLDVIDRRRLIARQYNNHWNGTTGRPAGMFMPSSASWLAEYRQSDTMNHRHGPSHTSL